jgi:hypothetical protein
MKTEQETIEKNLADYAQLKQEADHLKKKLDTVHHIIKDFFLNSGETYYERDGFDYKATLTTVNTDKLNEDKLIACLKTMKEMGDISTQKYNKIVKVKEYIDQDALEDAMYNGIIPATTVGICIDHKEPIYRLLVKGVNKK